MHEEIWNKKNRVETVYVCRISVVIVCFTIVRECCNICIRTFVNKTWKDDSVFCVGEFSRLLQWHDIFTESFEIVDGTQHRQNSQYKTHAKL